MLTDGVYKIDNWGKWGENVRRHVFV